MRLLEILSLEPVKDDTSELSLYGRPDNELLGISAFIIGKFSIIVIVLTLTVTSFLSQISQSIILSSSTIY